MAEQNIEFVFACVDKTTLIAQANYKKGQFKVQPWIMIDHYSKAQKRNY